ncbi:MAG: TetR family transcriptional regulator [Pseudomonadota bacterium]
MLQISTVGCTRLPDTMARRTKADALATRDNILDGAESLFVRQGVSRTTMLDIALEAGVSRGAIYWHFADKVAVVEAMLVRAKLPLDSAMLTLEQSLFDDPFRDLYAYATLVFNLVENDGKASRVYEIVTLKVEYVEEMTAVQVRRWEMAERWRALAMHRIHAAIDAGLARSSVEPLGSALALWALMDGLSRAWLLAPQSFSLTKVGRGAVLTFIDAMKIRFDE